MTNYYGKSAPIFVLKNKEGVTVYTYTLQSPQEMTEFPWKMVQEQNRDINGKLRSDKFKFEYECTYSWKPVDTSGNTYMQYLINIINWNAFSSENTIIYYPHSDKTDIFFEVNVTQGSPGIFSKIPYDAFTITVTSTQQFDKIIVDPDTLYALNADGPIILNEGSVGLIS